MQAGTLLANRYRIEAKLGEGGMGVVFKAHDTLLDRSVAIKTLSPHLLGEEGLKRLLREAQSAAKLTHPNVVATYDVVEDGDSRMIVMEYIEGRTLREAILLPWAEAVEIVEQVCRALSYAHAQGIVHRDIKPENIIITPGGIVKVMDFGLARSEGRSRLTQSGMIVGTVAYMAPEQALSGRSDARSDLYSLGAVLYETVTGKPPFVADDPISVISMHVNVPPVSPRFHIPDLPPVLESLIFRLLAKDPTERYASADEVAQVLRTAIAPVESQEGTALAEVKAAAPSLFEMMTRGRLIDREEDLAALKSALEAMLSGRGQVVLIAGEPGIGKTRLADELLIYARLRGCLAVVGHCYEQEVNIPYLPVSEALRAAFRSLTDDKLASLAGPHAPELVKLAPELSRRIPGLEASPPLGPDQERLRLYEAVAAFLTGLAKGQPLVILLDDLHWADAATLALLRHLARGTRSERVLIAGTYRDVEVDPDHPLSAALSEMNRERLYRRILVRGLSPDYVGAMIQAIFQTPQPVSTEFRDLIYRETEGNPFFVEEVLKHLVEVGALYIEEGRWGRKPIQDIDIPQSMREVIGRRLKRISEQCLQALSLAAVIGRRFEFEILQAIGDLSEGQLLDALEEALQAQLIREESDSGEVEYDFVHALVREVLYDRLSLRRRMTLHQKVGEALERQYGGRIDAVVEDLAHHFTRAPHGVGLEKAIQYSVEAARKSMRLFAYEEAVRYYRNAAELLAEAGDPRRLAETHLDLGDPLVYLNDTEAAVASYQRALQYYERQGTSVEVARVHRLIGRALQRRWEFSEAIPYLERALAHLNPETHTNDVMQTHLDLARAKTFLGKPDAAEQHAAQALALAEVAGDRSMQAAAHTALALAYHKRLSTANLEKALFHYAQAERLAREGSDPESFYTFGRALNNRAVLLQSLGEYDEALRLLLEAMEAGRRARDVEQITFYNLHLAWVYFVRGDWDAAKRHLAENLTMSLSPVRRQEVEFSMRWIEGDLEAATDLARGLLEHHQRGGEEQGTYFYSGLLVWLELELDRAAEAHTAAGRAAEFLERAQEYLLWTLPMYIIEALIRGGDHARGEALCAQAEALGRAVNSPEGMLAALHGRGILASTQGDLDRAVEMFSACPALAQRIGPLLHTYVLRTLASALLQRNRPGDAGLAKLHLQECLALCERMGDKRTASRVRAQLARLR